MGVSLWRTMQRLVAFSVVLAILAATCGGSVATPTSPEPLSASPTTTRTPNPTGTEMSPTGTPPSPTILPLASAGPSADGWLQVPDQASVRSVELNDVVWSGTRFVALGSGFDGNIAILDSTDGRIWHRQTNSATATAASDLAAGPPGLVALETIGGTEASGASADGLTWTVLPAAFSDATKPVAIATDVVATQFGWLAVGREDPACQIDCGTAPIRAVVWRSPDGLHWTRIAAQPSLEGGGMNAVTVGGPGFIAAGTVAGDAGFWTSADGATWARVPDAPMFHPRPGADSNDASWVSGLASDHGSIAAVGMDAAAGGGDYSVRAWRSVDGRTWTETTGDRFLGGQAFGIAATADGFLATGPSGVPSCRGGIWASSDGSTWRCIASDLIFQGFGPYAAAASPSVEIAVGLTSAGWDPNGTSGLPGAVWWRAVP